MSKLGQKGGQRTAEPPETNAERLGKDVTTVIHALGAIFATARDAVTSRLVPAPHMISSVEATNEALVINDIEEMPLSKIRTIELRRRLKDDNDTLASVYLRVASPSTLVPNDTELSHSSC